MNAVRTLLTGKVTRRGGGMFEFVLIFPLMIAFLLLMLDFSRILLIKAQVTDAAFAASRSSAQVGTAANAGQYVSDSLQYAPFMSKGNVTISSVTGYTSPGQPNCTVNNKTVTVTIVANIKPLFPGLSALARLSSPNGVAGAEGTFPVKGVGVARCEVVRE